MKVRTFIITGTDTGVGKTFLTSLLAQHLLQAGLRVIALKPLCTGDREDARILREATGATRTLDEINPWPFRAPLAPLLAARAERRRVRLHDLLAHARRWRSECDVLLLEGAGGLLTPLGHDFNARDLITGLRATPLIVAPNRLGAINQVLLVLAALSKAAARKALVVLVAPRQPTLASRSNPALLAELLGQRRLCLMPWQEPAPTRLKHPLDGALDRALRAIVKNTGLESCDPRRP